MKTKRTLSLILALVMIAAAFGVIAIPTAAAAANTAPVAPGATETTAPTPAADADKWDGTVDTTWFNDDVKTAKAFTITTAEQLAGLQKLVNDGTETFLDYTIKLGKDIVWNDGTFAMDKTGAVTYNGAAVPEDIKTWAGIGAYHGSYVATASRTDVFKGKFDGQNHVLSGFYSDQTGQSSVGFFNVFAGPEIKDVKLVNSYIHGNQHVGSMIGLIGVHNKAAISLSGLYSSAFVVFDATERSGGLIGGSRQTGTITMTDCEYAGTIVGTKATQRWGGVFGCVVDAHVSKNSVFSNIRMTGSMYANVNCGQTIGGIVGMVHKPDNFTLKDSVSNIKDTNIGVDVGAHKAYITSALVGSYDDTSSAWSVNIENCKWTPIGAFQNGKGGFTAPVTLNGKALAEWTGKDLEGKIVAPKANEDISWYTADTEADVFVVSTADQLDGLAYLVNNGIYNFAGKTVKLGADIVYNSGEFSVAADGSPLYNGQPVSSVREWPIIGYRQAIANDATVNDNTIDYFFAGNFDGAGHVISGLYVNNPTLQAVSLFTVFAGNEIKNTAIVNSYFGGHSRVASFAGCLANGDKGDVLLENLYSDAYLFTNNPTDYHTRSGGIVGLIRRINNLTVNKCWFDGSITVAGGTNNTNRYIGGLLGFIVKDGATEENTVVSNSLVTATYNFTDINTECIGGVFGAINGTLDDKGVTIENTLVIIDLAEGSKSVDVKEAAEGVLATTVGSSGFVGLLEGANSLTVTNSYVIANEQFPLTVYAGTASKVNGKDVAAAARSEVIGTAIAKPSEATGLDAKVFVLTDTGAVLNGIGACLKGTHVYGELKAKVEPSCDGDGAIAHYECANCGKYFDESKNAVADISIPASHNYGELKAEVPATCTANGTIAHYQCSLCQKTFNEKKKEVTDLSIPASHNYGELKAKVDATCTVDGMAAHYECSGCKKLFDETKKEVTDVALKIEAGHKYGTLKAKVDATCTTDGTVAHYECSVCKKTFDESKKEITDIKIPAGHTLGEWVDAKDATLEAAGVLGHYQCSVCNKYFDKDKNELESIEGAPKLTTPAVTTTAEQPATDAPATTTAPEKKSCGGFTAVGALLALLAVTGAAVVIKKK